MLFSKPPILNRYNLDFAREQSDAALAVTNYVKALPLYQRARDRRGEANCLKNLAFTAFSRNDRDAAKSFFRDALEIYQEISELYSVGMTHQALAQLASEVDDPVRVLVPLWEFNELAGDS